MECNFYGWGIYVDLVHFGFHILTRATLTIHEWQDCIAFAHESNADLIHFNQGRFCAAARRQILTEVIFLKTLQRWTFDRLYCL